MSKNDEFDLKRTLEKSFDEIQSREAQRINQYAQQRTTITGQDIIELLFSRIVEEAEAAKIGASNIYEKDNEPLPETISRLKDSVRGWIASWVQSGDLSILQGNVDRAFDSCVFPPKDLFQCIREKGVLGKMKSDGLIVDEGLREFIEKFGTQIPSSKAKRPKEGFLPAPAETKWDEVRIEITEDAQIRIGIKNKSQLYHLKKFTAEVIPQKKMQVYLYKIIRSGGVFTKEDIDPDADKKNFKNYVSRLRKQLQETFNIQDNPLPFKNKAYRIQFSVSSKPQE